jgi:hypothetical protein
MPIVTQPAAIRSPVGTSGSRFHKKGRPNSRPQV